MKNYHFLKYFLILSLLAPFSAQALQLASAKVLYVKGSPTYDTATEKKVRIQSGTIITEGTVITTGKFEGLDLIFSNGSELTIKENSKLIITKMEQNDFRGSESSIYPSVDPSKSVNLMTLEYGTVDGHVKKLRKESDFRIDTEFGTASILGTRFSIQLYFDPIANQFVLNVGNTDGIVEFTSQFGGEIDYGRGTIGTQTFDPDSGVQSVLIPPTRQIILNLSGSDPNYVDIVDRFPIEELPENQPEPDRPDPIPVITDITVDQVSQDGTIPTVTNSDI